MIDEWEYFYSMTRKTIEQKKVQCLRCKLFFRGSIANRTCGKCQRIIAQKSKLSESIGE